MILKKLKDFLSMLCKENSGSTAALLDGNKKKHHSSQPASDEFLLLLKKNGLMYIPDKSKMGSAFAKSSARGILYSSPGPKKPSTA